MNLERMWWRRGVNEYAMLGVEGEKLQDLRCLGRMVLRYTPFADNQNRRGVQAMHLTSIFFT